MTTSTTQFINEHDGWPTRFTDQHIAVEILRRHSEQFGHVKLLERVGEIDAGSRETFEVEFPLWLRELMQRFDSLYKPDVSKAAFTHTMEWLVRDIFQGQAAVSIQ